MVDVENTAIDKDLAQLGLILTGQDLDQRCLSGAVFADQRMDFAAVDRKADVVDSELPREGLRDRSEFEQGRTGASATGARPQVGPPRRVPGRVSHPAYGLHEAP